MSVNNNIRKDNITGAVLVFLAAVCFSIGGICIKLIPWSFLAINGARNLIGACVIGIYLLCTHHRIVLNKPVLTGALSTIGVTTFFILANKLTTAANAIVLQYTAPVFVILFMFLFFGIKPEKKEVMTCAAVFAGVCLFFIDGLKTGNTAGDMTAVLAGIFYAGVLMMNTAEDADPLSSCFLGQLAAGIIFAPLVLSETDFSAPVVTSVLLLGLIQVGLAYVFLSTGLKMTDAVTASLVTCLEPVMNPVWVALFYGEMITPLSAAGGVIVLTAVVLYNTLPKREMK